MFSFSVNYNDAIIQLFFKSQSIQKQRLFDDNETKETMAERAKENVRITFKRVYVPLPFQKNYIFGNSY